MWEKDDGRWWGGVVKYEYTSPQTIIVFRTKPGGFVRRVGGKFDD